MTQLRAIAAEAMFGFSVLFFCAVVLFIAGILQ